MIKGAFRFTNSEQINYFSIEGHGGISSNGNEPVKGNDILCAGVSTLIQSILIGLQYVAKVKIDFIKKDGFLECKVGKPEKKEVSVLLNTLYLSLKELERQYPDNIKIDKLR